MRGAIAAVSALALLFCGGPAIGAESLKLVADIPLSGPVGRFDYQSIDPVAQRLYISHMGTGAVVVFDLKARREIARLPGFPGATGILAVPALHRVFVSVTGHWWNNVMGGGEVAAIDTTTLKTVWRVPAGRFPDGIVYVSDRLFISDERGQQELVLDTASGRVVTTIGLGGEAGMSALDALSGKVLVNVQTRNQIAVINPTGARIERRITLPGTCRNNHGLLIDAPWAFVACDNSANLFMLDLASGEAFQSATVGKDPDVLTLDPGLNRLYVASESGVVSVFSIKDKTIRKLWEGMVGDDAHSIVADHGLVYLPLRNLNGHPALRIMDFK